LGKNLFFRVSGLNQLQNWDRSRSTLTHFTSEGTMNPMRMLIAVTIFLALGLGAARAQSGTAALTSVGPGSKAGYINIQGSNTPNGMSTWNMSLVTIWITGGTGDTILDAMSIGAGGNFNVDVGGGNLKSGQSYWIYIVTTFDLMGNGVEIASDPLKGAAK
jgi:hypothetical protein